MNLDLHCQMMLEDCKAMQPVLQTIRQVVENQLRKLIDDNGIYVTAIESRVKTLDSFAGKLERKGYKYRSIMDITDLVGCRIITFYTDEVDKISALVERTFHVDWDASVDKRKMHEIDRFGYQSLHYICRIPKELYHDDACPQINEIRFEIQMRTALQHVWATINHDNGYKTTVEIPQEHLRSMSCLAGMLELADEQFSRIRKEIHDYRRNVQRLVANGNFDQVPLDGDTFRSYLELRPFDKLANRIAAINQAEIFQDNLMPYIEVFRKMNISTLGQLESMIKEYSDDAYNFALHQIGGTDLDIITLSVAVQNLCWVRVIRRGYGIGGLEQVLDVFGGTREVNRKRAERLYAQAVAINIVCKVNGE